MRTFELLPARLFSIRPSNTRTYRAEPKKPDTQTSSTTCPLPSPCPKKLLFFGRERTNKGELLPPPTFSSSSFSTSYLAFVEALQRLHHALLRLLSLEWTKGKRKENY